LGSQTGFQTLMSSLVGEVFRIGQSFDFDKDVFIVVNIFYNFYLLLMKDMRFPFFNYNKKNM